MGRRPSEQMGNPQMNEHSSRAVQSRRRQHVNLPDAYHCKPGDTFTVEYKNQGQVERVATFTLVAYEEDGELKHRWVQR